jgi:glycosyltransferase involved in cell wall biosynthesis
MQQSKRILIVNYDFPPAGGAGIKRGLKFMKYLRPEGWTFEVLTVNNGNHGIVDTSLLHEIDNGVKVTRTATLENVFGKKMRDEKSSAEIPEKKSYLDPRVALKSIYNIFGAFVKIPDSRILWVPPAVIQGIRLAKTKQISLIFSTGPSFSNMIAAAIIARLSGLPLVLDFRDAWTGDPMLMGYAKKYLRPAHRWLEKSVIKSARLVLTTNPFVTRDFINRYTSLSEKNCITIYNGFDVDDMESVKDIVSDSPDKFTIVYTGRLYGERSPKAFIDALGKATKELPEIAQNMKVYFVGSCEKFLDGKFITEYIKTNNIEGTITLTGHLPRKKSLEYQMQASVLLMIIGIVPKEMELTYGLSGKVFDYLLFGKPILTIANGGSTREFIEENKIGTIYYHEDVDGIKDYLIKSYNDFKNKTPLKSRDLHEFRSYNIQEQIRVLSRNLESLLSK